MMEGLAVPFLSACAAFLVSGAVFHLRHSRALKSAHKFLHLAKRETRETAQISLGNPYPLVQVTGAGRVIFINPAAFECFPGIREQGLEHPVLKGLPGIMRDSTSSSREVVFSETVYDQTIVRTKANDEDAFTIYCYDVTERKAYERNLQASREEADRANRARGDFLANMSHELRTPMNGIIGLSEILMDAGMKPEHQEMIEAVNSSAHNLLVLLNEILDFSKIEAGELTLEAIPFDLRKIVKQVESLQRPVAARKGLVMKSAVSDIVPQLLTGDPSRLQQILNNLIGNALKFTEEGSVTISVGGEEDGKGNFVARIAVSDTGIGIPKDRQGKMFQKFQQADASTARKYGGTGLGLAISKNLAELMGGGISLQSEEGKGATFTVTIPAQIAAAETAVEAGRDAAGTGVGVNRRAKILVVDDHPVNRLVMRQALARLGFADFEEAESGRQAIDLYREGGYDLILMDCQMPEMDGYETAQRIRKMGFDNRKPAIIAVTANAMKGASDKCKAAGMDDYISKPVDRDKLKIVLQRWLPGTGVTEMKKAVCIPLPEPEKSCKSATVFDWDHLLEYTGGSKETEKMLLDMFLGALKEDVGRLQKNFSENNFQEWEAVAHKLHGASAHMGAYALAEICDAAQSLQPSESAKMRDIHPLILRETQRVYGLLEKRNAAA